MHRTYSTSWILALNVLLLSHRPVHCHDGKNEYYQMNDICKNNFLRDLYRKIDGAVLTSQNERDLDCAITFQTHSILQRFMLRFDQLHLDCNDHLYIYDGAHAVGSYKCAYIALLAIVAVTALSDCDPTKCRGPLKYYEDLGCKPVYKDTDTKHCCPIRYDCEHLKSRSPNKCYVNNNEYAIGEHLKEEDSGPCDIGCFCEEDINGIAYFLCAIVDCFPSAKEGCYLKNSPSACCPGPEVCPEKPEDRATCVYNGTTYYDGEYMEVNEPNLSCYCQPGYTGENVEPFCQKPKRPYCDPHFLHRANVLNNCAPAFYSDQQPMTSCSIFSRCQNSNDTVIRHLGNEEGKKSSEEEEVSEEMQCKFGNMMLKIGDELNQATDYSSVCMKCVCEVPPLLTCQRISDDVCNVTKHPPFSS